MNFYTCIFGMKISVPIERHIFAYIFLRALGFLRRNFPRLSISLEEQFLLCRDPCKNSLHIAFSAVGSLNYIFDEIIGSFFNVSEFTLFKIVPRWYKAKNSPYNR